MVAWRLLGSAVVHSFTPNMSRKPMMAQTTDTRPASATFIQLCLCKYLKIMSEVERPPCSADVHINIALTSNGPKWISEPSLYANDSFAFCFWKAVFSLQVWFMLHVYFEKETSYQILKMSLHNYFRIFMPLLIWVVNC